VKGSAEPLERRERKEKEERAEETVWEEGVCMVDMPTQTSA